jgi:hypothetical protein
MCIERKQGGLDKSVGLAIQSCTPHDMGAERAPVGSTGIHSGINAWGLR